VAEDFESRRELGDTGRFLGKPKVAAWAIVAVLVLTGFIGLGNFGGRAHTGTQDSAGIVNPTHDAHCPGLPVPVLDRCRAQRRSGPEDLSDSP
jgi:hypothetical protein